MPKKLPKLNHLLYTKSISMSNEFSLLPNRLSKGESTLFYCLLSKVAPTNPIPPSKIYSITVGEISDFAKVADPLRYLRTVTLQLQNRVVSDKVEGLIGETQYNLFHHVTYIDQSVQIRWHEYVLPHISQLTKLFHTVRLLDFLPLSPRQRTLYLYLKGIRYSGIRETSLPDLLALLDYSPNYPIQEIKRLLLTPTLPKFSTYYKYGALKVLGRYIKQGNKVVGVGWYFSGVDRGRLREYPIGEVK